MDTLSPAWPPAPASPGGDEKPRALSNHFGADITDDAADGINAVALAYQATWELHWSDADALLNFLRAHAGRAFLWTMPRETRARAWEATSWARASLTGEQDQVQATFEERTLP